MHKWFELLRGGPNAPDPEHPGTEAERSTSAAIRQLERRAGVDVVEPEHVAEERPIRFCVLGEDDDVRSVDHAGPPGFPLILQTVTGGVQGRRSGEVTFAS